MGTNKKTFSEKRQFPRFLVNNEYTLIIDEKKYQGVIGNISLGGVYLKEISPSISYDNLNQKGEISLKLSEDEVNISCLITFVAASKSNLGQGGAGIAFSNVDMKTMELLIAFISDLEELV